MSDSDNILDTITKNLGLSESEESLFLDVAILTYDQKQDERESLIAKIAKDFPAVLEAVKQWAAHLGELESSPV